MTVKINCAFFHRGFRSNRKRGVLHNLDFRKWPHLINGDDFTLLFQVARDITLPDEFVEELVGIKVSATEFIVGEGLHE